MDDDYKRYEEHSELIDIPASKSEVENQTEDSQLHQERKTAESKSKSRLFFQRVVFLLFIYVLFPYLLYSQYHKLVNVECWVSSENIKAYEEIQGTTDEKDVAKIWREWLKMGSYVYGLLLFVTFTQLISSGCVSGYQ